MASGGVDWKAIREDFPILRERAHGHPLIYFDSAATSQKPQAVLDALRNYYEHNNANVHRGLHELSSRATEAYETSRQHVAKYIGAATADEIIFTRGTTEGINLVAQAWGGKFLRAGDVILLTEMEHHSNLVPWQLLAARTGVRLRFVPVRDDGAVVRWRRDDRQRYPGKKRVQESAAPIRSRHPEHRRCDWPRRSHRVHRRNRTRGDF